MLFAPVMPEIMLAQSVKAFPKCIGNSIGSGLNTKSDIIVFFNTTTKIVNFIFNHFKFAAVPLVFANHISAISQPVELQKSFVSFLNLLLSLSVGSLHEIPQYHYLLLICFFSFSQILLFITYYVWISV